MQRVFQRFFKPSHYHTSGHTRGTFWDENTIIASEIRLAVKKRKVGNGGVRNLKFLTPTPLALSLNILRLRSDTFVSFVLRLLLKLHLIARSY